MILTNIRLRPPSTASFNPPQCALTKQGERFLTSLSTIADDSTATNHLIRKFVTSSPKAVTLTTFSHLLSPTPIVHPHLSLLALPVITLSSLKPIVNESEAYWLIFQLYRRMSEAPWFSWNPKLIAELIALLESQSRFDEARILTSETVSKLGLRERELVLFYSNLIECKLKYKSVSTRLEPLEAEACLREMILSSSSVYVKLRAYEALVRALCEMGRVVEGEGLVTEMRRAGLKASVFEFRCVVQGYGRMGMFEDMMRSVDVMEEAGYGVDTVCSNMILSCYGEYRRYVEMAGWIRKMRESGVGLTIRTYNSVLNSCEKMMVLMRDVKGLPLCMKELVDVLDGDEGLVVRELVESSVLSEVMEMSSAEGKLDLHGMHLGTAYLTILQWMEEFRVKWSGGELMIPKEMVVVCGLGKHSMKRGESPVKEMVKVILARMESPLRLDRKNAGCLRGKGKAFKTWLFEKHTGLEV